MRKQIIPIFIALLALAGITYLWSNSDQPEAQVIVPEVLPSPTAVSANAPEVLPLANSALRSSIISAGDYLV
ncbi:MAG: hypothetical protein RL275_1428, partial [Chloroflexota bacterium]